MPASRVTSRWRSGWWQRPAATRRRSGTKSVSVSLCVCSCVCAGLAVVVHPRRVTLVCWVSRRGQYDTTALLEACSRGHLAVVQWLVTEAGSDAASERDNVSCAAHCHCRVSLARRRSPPVARRDACPRRRQCSNRLRAGLPRFPRCVVVGPGHTLHGPPGCMPRRSPRRRTVAPDERAQRRGIGARQRQSAAVLAVCLLCATASVRRCSRRVSLRVPALLFDCVLCAVHLLAVVWRRGQLGATALLVACRTGHLAVAQWLVTSAHSDAASERDRVSLLLLSPSLHVPALFVLTVAVLLRGDASRCGQGGATALLTACRHGHLDVVQWLVTEAGSDAASERNNVSCAAHCRCRVLLARRRSSPVARRDACPRRGQFSSRGRLRSELPRFPRCVVA
jgi:hypothetical protein